MMNIQNNKWNNVLNWAFMQVDLTCIVCALGHLPQNDVLEHVGKLSFLWWVCRAGKGTFHKEIEEDKRACWLIAATASILHIPKMIWTSWNWFDWCRVANCHGKWCPVVTSFGWPSQASCMNCKWYGHHGLEFSITKCHDK